MANIVYSIKITLDNIKILDDCDWFGAGEIYLLATIDGHSTGRSPTFKAHSGSTIPLTGAQWSREVRVYGRSNPVNITVQVWDEDLVWDDPLGSLAVSVASPWEVKSYTTRAPAGKFELTWNVGQTAIVLGRTSIGRVSRQYNGSSYVTTLVMPRVAFVKITEIRGLYKPGVDDRTSPAPGTTKNASYVAGYISDDDRGRIFTNRLPDGTWQNNTQYIELTAEVFPTSVILLAGSKIKWTIEDPDDPTNEGPTVHASAGRMLDPNDYNSSGTKTGAHPGDNDPNGAKGKGGPAVTPRLEQIDPTYALSGDETAIDIPNRVSKVRYQVSDVAGDNYIIKAELVHAPGFDVNLPTQTGIMTVWDRVDLEYVKMASAPDLPVDQIAQHYDIACVQVDVTIKREVTGASDKPHMGTSDGAAFAACETYCTSTHGEFTHEGTGGWFFIVSANRFMPARTATILFEGNAEAHGNIVRLPAGTVFSEDYTIQSGDTLSGIGARYGLSWREIYDYTGGTGTPNSSRLSSGNPNLIHVGEVIKVPATPKVVRVFNAARMMGVSSPWPDDRDKHIKFRIASISGRDLTIVRHDFYTPDDPDHAFLEADLSHYGFTAGQTIPVQVLSAGDNALVVAGISPGGTSIGGKHYFGGKLIIFTAANPTPADQIGTLCHELCHAFDNAHKCGNWDWRNQANRTACCMNYWFQFVLDDSTPRAAIPWTQNRVSPDLCAPHIRRMRDYHLEHNPGLGW